MGEMFQALEVPRIYFVKSKHLVVKTNLKVLNKMKRLVFQEPLTLGVLTA